MKKLVILLAAMLMGAMVLEAAPRKVPTAALKALKSSKNKKAIRTGMVFMDGKFIPAPYTVERYGTALRINGVQVTGPMIAWDEFLKTQEGAKVVTNTTEIPGEAAGAEPEEPEETYEEDDDDEDPLAALFDVFKDSRAYALEFRSAERTLTDEEVGKTFQRIVEALKELS